MDPFGEERPEFTGSLISIEFGPGGRMTQLWAVDPMLPEEGEEFQFIVPPLGFGEEAAEDYYPGTILLGARLDPESPWVLSRNNHAQLLFPMAEESLEAQGIEFEYDFALLPELRVTGKFYEIPGLVPQIAWDIDVRNRGKVSIEIGELAFPLAFNNFYDGFGWSDEQLRRLWTSRLYIHKFIGGAASWVFAQRMTAEPPGILVFPGEDTSWEFYSTVPASLNTPHQWEGIPVVYIYSRAAAEREGWNRWVNDHSSLILEAGDFRRFHMRFATVDRDKQDGVHQALVACGRPSFRLLPGAVGPTDVGVAVEVGGCVPARFFSSRDALVETESDEEGGFCFVKPTDTGPFRLTVEDTLGRLSHAHLMFIEPIETLIKKRAAYIAGTQVHPDDGSALSDGILLTNVQSAEQVVDPEEYSGASGIECSLADALFLAEKNAIYPDRQEIEILDRYLSHFLLDDIQNPGDMSVGSVLAEGNGVGMYSGRPITYPHVFNLYHSMFAVAESYGGTSEQPKTYLSRAAQTALSMFKFGWRHYVRTVGLLGYARIYDLLSDLQAQGLHEEYAALYPQVLAKANDMVRQSYPYAGESVLDTSGFEEVYSAARFLQNDEHLERTLRCAFAARSLSPSWWWYGSDKRSWDGADSTPLRALIDRGEVCLAHTTISNSLIFFESIDRDYLAVPEAYMRLACGGMIGPWALIRKDGAASMCFCPDLSSKHAGYNPYTGASGLGYFHYLRTAASYVLPNRSLGTFSFGCHFESDGNSYVVRPWEGVGRRIYLRQIGAEFELSFGKFDEVKMDSRKRKVEARISNPCDKDVTANLVLRGLWGSRLSIDGKLIDAVNGEMRAAIALPGKKSIVVTGTVVQ
ncbi:MAG: hypothetical protein HONBIEJF_02779 [Fimbriimonadaceae bacterium]|nr:hypothetical protein [Fimbriimonadaceae bacterium]